MTHVIVMGNPADGFSYIGPFDDADKALEYVSGFIDDCWWVAELSAPEKD